MYFLAGGSARKGLVDAGEWVLERGAAGDGRKLFNDHRGGYVFICFSAGVLISVSFLYIVPEVFTMNSHALFYFALQDVTMKFRKIVSLTAMVSFTVLILTGIVLFIQPHGRVAYWVDWRLWGLSKTQWDSTHIHAGILFLLAIVLHIYYNWCSIVSYLKGKADQFRVFNLHFNIALLITSLVVCGTIARTPPFCWVMDLNESMRESAVKTYGKPPYGHAELSPLKTLAFRMGFDLGKSIQGLKTAGINFEGINQRIVDIARSNGKTPKQVFDAMIQAQEAPATGEGE